MKKGILIFGLIIIISIFWISCDETIVEQTSLVTIETTSTAIPVETTEKIIETTELIVPTIKPKDYGKLKSNLEIFINEQEGMYGIYFIDLVSGDEFGINYTNEYIAASTSKLPITLLLFKKIASGEIDPNMILDYREEDFESGTGIIQNENYGAEYTVLETARLSIVYSDNCGINMIIRLLGLNNVREYMQEIGGSIYYDGRHRSCPKDMAIYMKVLYDFYLENPDIAGILIDNLENTVFNDRINLLLPKSVRVPHKIGNFSRTANDVGIVFGSVPYIISIMSDDVDFSIGTKILSEISKKVYDFVEEQGRK